ncbi:DUF2799 domain-containing protein [Echinimonas agarilytica]|uniref:DUF2799 domain-containing protein n=1 Tax=Echinimonas agarilytica TaxID=1215918 RepID=A0AA41WBJ1_9GAMM|nr:DUF2799 domain-containing protein [Echinimonas agarilytica]MCM2681333.1 DUF2799 domain-containing protein [Echinimonas agarilytica]
MNNYSPLALIALGFLSACQSTLPDIQCDTIDWLQVGIEDAKSGAQQTRLNEYSEQCQSKDWQPNQANYEQGVTIGKTQYCTYHQGLKLGKSGETYNAQCTGHNEARFLRAYVLGRGYFLIESDLLTKQAQMSSLDLKIASVKNSIDRLQTSSNLSQAEQARLEQLHTQLNDMESVRFEIEDQIQSQQAHFEQSRQQINKTILADQQSIQP